MDAAEKLSQYSIRQATMHVEKGEFPLALEWIEKLSAADRPVNLYAEICYRLSCAAIAEWELKKAAGFINKAHSLNGDCYIYQKKAELLRKVPGELLVQAYPGSKECIPRSQRTNKAYPESRQTHGQVLD